MTPDTEIAVSVNELIIHLLAALNGGEGLRGTFRIIILSETAILAANLEIVPDHIAEPIVKKENGLILSIEKLRLSQVYCMHVLPIIRMSGLNGESAKKAKSLWSKRNVEIILSKECGNILFVPTTKEIKCLFVGTHKTEPIPDCDSSTVRLSGVLSAIVMVPTKFQLDHWSIKYKLWPTSVGFDEMFDTLLLVAAGGLKGN